MSAGHGLEPDEDTIVSLHDVLEEDEELENTANAVLGDSDDKDCSYSKVWWVGVYWCKVVLYFAT